ncbi:hypothetical protein BDA96_09G261300 [Sorghum bicolor]|jgi:hypothetical protein|uniref:DUF7378 domain-containing protein n=2 Tax=Sorghum bicolor TaxID=4558 RepID=A0A921U5U6_SORBI|nr:hypothetical protein BDA96_09G261300 [Sorghum bicolor]OQU78501.1 hypothetical protein SORBI_3009G246250 [Sorghum bicolor]
MVLLATRVQEMTLKFLDHDASRAFEWVMQAVASSELTIGEKNQMTSRLAQWIITIWVPSIFIFSFAALGFIIYNDPNQGAGFLWRLPFLMLPAIYVAMIYVAMGYLRLFVPSAPFAAWEALYKGAYMCTAMPSVMINFFVALYCQVWIVLASACLQALLMAAVVAFWIWVVRTYSK